MFDKLLITDLEIRVDRNQSRSDLITALLAVLSMIMMPYIRPEWNLGGFK